jgi:uncharacterized protein DUF6924
MAPDASSPPGSLKLSYPWSILAGMRPLIDRTDELEFDALIVRTDFSDDTAWQTVRERLAQPAGDDFEPGNQFVDDPAYAGATPDEILTATAGDQEPSVVFLADAESMRGDHPLLAVSTLRRADFDDDEEFEDEFAYGREFRILPGFVAELHTNLAIANMDFWEFARTATEEPDGTFRGFPEPEPEPDEPWEGWNNPSDGHRLGRGQTLRDAALTSPNGRFQLLTKGGWTSLRQDGEGIWVPGPGMPTGTGIHLDDDGELQYRTAGGKGWPLIPDFEHRKGRSKQWPVDARGRPAAARGAHALLVRDNGDIDLVDEQDQTMWSFGTATHVTLLGEIREMSTPPPRA